jgi:gamma-glutamyltranspeptidase/glutathione hydrolase
MSRDAVPLGVRGPLRTGRSTIMAPRGMIATGHPLATTAGLNVLQHGGNAMDAALAAAAVLGVVQPMMSGVGGETFLLWFDARLRRVWALNGSGAAPRAATLERFRRMMPVRGMASASVPGAIDAMVTALERWGSGRFALAELLEPAINYAEEGVPVAPVVAEWIREATGLFEKFPSSAGIFAPAGRPLRAGELLVQRELAASLRQIAEGGAEAFYRGPLAKAVADYAAAHDGLLTLEDLRAHRTEVVDPLVATYHDLKLYTPPPPSQGIIVLMMLNILEGFPRDLLRWGNPEGIHFMVEAKKRAFADRLRHLGDPRFVSNPIEMLLDKEDAARQRDEIVRGVPVRMPARESTGDTTYLCVGDRERNLVSFITSLSAKFGCGEVIDGTGILLNNRAGRGFALDPTHPNCLAPGKRTMHTLMPFMAFEGAAPRYLFGTPGGDGQPQWNLQVLLNLVESKMDVQEAVEAPRWFSFPGTDPATADQPFELALEEGFPDEAAEALRARGHRVVPMQTEEGKGVQVIGVDDGFYRGGSDPRIDGVAIGY